MGLEKEVVGNMDGGKIMKLPVGIQTFDDIRRDGYIYVDKTKYLLELIDSGKVFFLSRPRRFGKSLTISTFDALFSEKQELFKGLYAEKYFKRADYRPYPVLRFDMSKVETFKGAEILERSIFAQIQSNARRQGVSILNSLDSSLSFVFNELIEKVSEKHGPVVILIDEYDKPILDVLKDKEKAALHRQILRGFYTQIKANDELIKFVFITGITKFTKTGMFSAMNNLKDISMTEAYSEMLGLTENELIVNFKDHIKRTSGIRKVTEEKLLSQMRAFYDGFSFDGVHRVYNPFSTLNFFDESVFNYFWFETGQATFVSNYIEEHQLHVEDLRGKVVSGSFASAHEIENAEPESFLFQAGYLTLRQRHEQADMELSFVLDYPNIEVLKSVAKLFVGNVARIGNDLSSFNMEITAAFDSEDPSDLIKTIDRLFASIPYNLFSNTEKYYHSLIYCMMVSAGIDARAEDRSRAGSADIVVHRGGQYYVLELKVSQDETLCKKAAEAAIAQIRMRGYYEKFPKNKTKLIGLAIDMEKKKVGHFIIEAA